MASEQDITVFSNPDENNNELLVFTNGKGEPKCIDVESTLTEKTNDSGSYIGSTSGYDKQDFLDACPRVDLRPLTFSFDNDGSSRSFFKKSRGIQFSYQVIYKKGSISALAPFSDIAIPPSLFGVGTDGISDLEVENLCNVYFPTPGDEVQGYRFVFREGNDGAVRVVDDIIIGNDNQNFVLEAGTGTFGYYMFYNNVSGSILNEVDALKTFDNVPKVAGSQEVTEDRLIYSNYEEGFNNIDVDVTSSITFYDAPPPGYDFNIKAKSFLFRRTEPYGLGTTALNDNGDTLLQGDRAYHTSPGFLLDDSRLPDLISGGTYDITVSLRPKNNFHFFMGEGEGPESLENLFFSAADSYGIPHEPDDSRIHFSHSREGIPSFSLFNGVRYAGRGVTIDNPASGNMEPIQWQSSNGNINVSTGRRSTSPFILKGGVLKFRAVLNVPEGGVSKNSFVNSLSHAFYGLPPNTSPLVGLGGSQAYPVTDDQWFYKHSYDLNLSDGSEFSHEESENSDLIISFTENNSSTEGGRAAAGAPQAFAIVNKVSANFALEPAASPSNQNKYWGEINHSGKYRVYDGSEPYSFRGFKLSLGYIDELEFKTCIPKPVSTFGSRISPDAYTSTSDYAAGETDISNRLRCRRFVARGTSIFDSARVNGADTVIWPSVEKQLMAGPDGPQGPALQHLPGAVGSFVIPGNAAAQTSPVLGLPMSGTMEEPSGQGAGAVFQTQRMAFNPLNGVDGFIQSNYHPAPIGSWLVFDVVSSVSPSYWNSQGWTLYQDVAESTAMSPLVLFGRPSEMLGEISKYYEGQIDASSSYYSNGDVAGFSKFCYSFHQRPSSGNTDSIRSRCRYNSIDGYAGVGGGGAALKRGFGDSSSDENSAWGFSFVNGTHDMNDVNVNVCGAYSNERGSVTNFNLLGFVDNMPGYKSGEIIKRDVSKFDGYTSSAARTEFVRDAAISKTFALAVPVYIRGPIIDNDAIYYDETSNLSMNQVQSGDTVSTQFRFQYIPAEGSTAYGQYSFLPESHWLHGSTLAYNGNFRSHSRVIQNAWPSDLTPSLTSANVSINTNNLELYSSSFKTNASHQFGIVYYDGKGRHGSVQPVGSVFVPGYSERPDGKRGPARISLTINHAPPDWAEHYRIVYGGNSSVERFIQYTVDGGYLRVSGNSSERKKNIYISLNSLQNSPVSFQSEYSAVNQYDGSREIYRYAEGDFLRILYYSDAGGETIYPSESYEFAITDLVTLAPGMEDHPLFSDGSTGGITDPTLDLSRSGQFLVVENNTDATGFSGNDIFSGLDLWKNRVVVEIVRPKTGFTEDQTVYYETNYGGTVSGSPGSKTHQYNTIHMIKGDVWYRGTPMNIQRYEEGGYVPLANGPEALDLSYSNFSTYYIEHEGFSDYFVSKSKNYGRLHFVNPNQTETVRTSSLSFSEQTSPGSYDVNWFSFPQIGNYKDLNTTYGKIKAMDYDGVYMNVFFEDAVSRVPYNRNMISSLQDDILVASTKVFGTEKEMGYHGGVGNHPESVLRIDEDYFFVNPSRAEIVMLKNRQSPVIISDMNISSYFKNQLKKWKESSDFKISTGHDPRNRELIVSLCKKFDNVNWAGDTDSQDLADLKSLAFDLKSKKAWKSRYSFASSDYATLGDSLISWHTDTNTSGHVYPHIHSNSAPNNTLYNRGVDCEFTCYLNDALNESKIFNSVVTDSEDKWRVSVGTGKLVNETTDFYADVSNFNRRYEKWYGIIPPIMEASETPLSSEYSYLYNLPTFPLTAHGNRWVKFLPNLKIESEQGKVHVSVCMSYPDGHPALSTAIPNGVGSRLYEIGANQTIWDPSNKRAIRLGTNRNPGGTASPQAYDNSWLSGGYVPQWYVSGVKRSDIHSNQNGESYDIIFKCDFTSHPANGGTGLVSKWIEFYEANQNLVDSHGFLTVRDAFLYGEPMDTYDFGRMMEVLFSPLYSYYFPGEGINDNLEMCFALNYLEQDGEVFVDSGEEWESAIYDLNEDGAVTTADLLAFLSDFGLEGEGLAGDFNADGAVSTADLLEFLVAFGTVDPSAEPVEVDFASVGVDEISFAEFVLRLPLTGTLQDRLNQIKRIYSSYPPHLDGTKARGRYLEIKCSNETSTKDKMFGIEVDYDVDIKSSSSNLKPRSNRAKRR